MKTNKKTCYVYLFDGFSDWEVSYASVGIRKSENFQVKTISLSMKPLTSMGGLAVLPDVDFVPEVDLTDIDSSNTSMLILPGGTAWESRSNEEVIPLVKHCLQEGITVAAICGATILLADLGVLNNITHTSNDVVYLESLCPGYSGRDYYLNEPAVSSRGLITASGSAPIEFAREVFLRLDILKDEPVSEWFNYMEKHRELI